MNEEEIQKLRAAGFSDDDIQEYTASQQNRTQAAPTAQPDSTVELDPNAPSETLTRAQQAGVATEARPSSFLSDVATAAPVLAGQYAVPIAAAVGGAGALYGANQLRQGMQARAGAQTATAAAQQAQAQAMMEQARAAQMQAQGLQERFAQRQATAGARAAPPGSQILGPNAQPIRPMAPPAPPAAAPAMAPPAPPAAAPAMAPPAPQQPGLLSRMVSAAAPYARAAARVAGPAAVLYEGLQPRTLNTGEQQQLAQMQSPESVAATQRNRQAIAQAGRQPRNAADLDQMIKAAAAKKALIGQ